MWIDSVNIDMLREYGKYVGQSLALRMCPEDFLSVALRKAFKSEGFTWIRCVHIYRPKMLARAFGSIQRSIHYDNTPIQSIE